jgi:magnesium-protoporphyrin O-methyltransferase
MASIQEHCCGTDMFFDKKKSNKEYRDYLKKGPSRITAKIIKQLTSQTIEGKSLLDVGGGIGALQWWFLTMGGAQTSSIDASSSYLLQSQNHATENEWGSKTQFIFGDYTEVHNQVHSPDYITLDKVICCYPNFKEIIEISCFKANSHVALSYPTDDVFSKIIFGLIILFMEFKRNSFRPYIHPVKSIRKAFEQYGYERVSYAMAFPWHIETYRKIADGKVTL